MDDTRGSSDRLATQRRGIARQPRSRLDVDLTGLPAGMEAIWVRESCLGQEDRGNVEDAVRGGMIPATTDMLPGNAPIVLPGDDPPKSKLIRHGGQILMLAPKADLQADRAMARRASRENIASAQRVATTEGAAIDNETFVESPSVVSDAIERRAPGRPPRTTKFAD